MRLTLPKISSNQSTCFGQYNQSWTFATHHPVPPRFYSGPQLPPCTAFYSSRRGRPLAQLMKVLVISWNDTNPNSESSAEEAGFKILPNWWMTWYDRTGTNNPPVAILPTHPGSGQMTYTYMTPPFDLVASQINSIDSWFIPGKSQFQVGRLVVETISY